MAGPGDGTCPGIGSGCECAACPRTAKVAWLLRPGADPTYGWIFEDGNDSDWAPYRLASDGTPRRYGRVDGYENFTEVSTGKTYRNHKWTHITPYQGITDDAGTDDSASDAGALAPSFDLLTGLTAEGGIVFSPATDTAITATIDIQWFLEPGHSGPYWTYHGVLEFTEGRKASDYFADARLIYSLMPAINLVTGLANWTRDDTGTIVTDGRFGRPPDPRSDPPTFPLDDTWGYGPTIATLDWEIHAFWGRVIPEDLSSSSGHWFRSNLRYNLNAVIISGPTYGPLNTGPTSYCLRREMDDLDALNDMSGDAVDGWNYLLEAGDPP